MEMGFNQKQRKPIMFTAHSSKNAQGYCQPNKVSFRYNLALHTHDKDNFPNFQNKPLKPIQNGFQTEINTS